MTFIQSIMLSVCFGAVLGYLIAGMGFIIKEFIEKHKAKKKQ